MRSDNISLISASRNLGVSGEEMPDERKAIRLYRLGEYRPGKDKYQHICENCPLPDCIREEGDMTPLGAFNRTYEGCPIYDRVIADRELKLAA